MKDKSRFISSVIVSLLAGFTYYQFAGDINEKFQNSVRTILSSNDFEECCDNDFPAFDTPSIYSAGKDLRVTKYSVREKQKPVGRTNVPMISENGSEFQAKNVRPSADRNVDFTAELEHLKRDSKSLPSRQLKIETGRRNNNEEFADTRELKKKSNLLHKDFENKTGNGFEYNVMFETQGTPEAKIGVNKTVTFTSDSECRYEMQTSVNSYYKIGVKAPKQKPVRKIERKKIEVNIEDESSDDDSM